MAAESAEEATAILLRNLDTVGEVKVLPSNEHVHAACEEYPAWVREEFSASAKPIDDGLGNRWLVVACAGAWARREPDLLIGAPNE